MAGLVSLASAISTRFGGPKAEAYLIELKETDDSPTGRVLKFQYFPESVNSTKSPEYKSQTIPGGSLPLYQFVAGGEHSLSFGVVFTCDADLMSVRAEPPGRVMMDRVKAAGIESRNVDIRSAVAWLRSLISPRYSSADAGSIGVPLTFAPRKVKLVMPNSGIGLLSGISKEDAGVMVDSLICHMDQCDVTYEQFFPSGLPKIVEAQLAFKQLAQFGGQVRFPAASSELDSMIDGQTTLLGYTLRPSDIRRR